ncbi:DoxX family membrane protein [Agromyces protaetiae]|uniref:DoxX family membrane protein n=1 Tax=Agromyces protaetiae TaxID=2509455 RepID=A0A4P6FTM9_9MICO|nr:DoxX family membrane protein [Agromyces protaetiae]QAY73918.1 DoxX family membrane protein [Agromyces protaetiae]
MSSVPAAPGIQPVGLPPVPAVTFGIFDRLRAAEAGLKTFLEKWSVGALRVSLGLVFVVFGALKFIPGASPLESLVEQTWGVLTFGIVGGQLALILTAIIETTAGVLLVSGKFARVGLVVLALAFVGILSPIAFFPGELFTETGPTLLGQYIVKNVVLIAAALVVASKVLRGPARR